MAGDWIKMRIDLDNDPVVVALAAQHFANESRTIGERNAHILLIVGALWKLWSIGNEQTVDGMLTGYVPAILDAKVGIEGFSESLARHGWLLIHKWGLEIPKFLRHNGVSAKRRAQARDRMKTLRSCSQDVALTAQQDENDLRTKRREEKSIILAEPPDVGSTAKKARSSKKPKAPPKPRPRDPLFDAIAEVTSSDPKVSGSHIAKVRHALAAAEPPYTPEEVRLWAEMVRREWNLKGPPTLGMMEKHIGRVRASQPSKLSQSDLDEYSKQQSDLFDSWQRDIDMPGKDTGSSQDKRSPDDAANG